MEINAAVTNGYCYHYQKSKATVNVFNQTQSGIKCKPFIPPLAENRLSSIREKYNKIPIGNDDGYLLLYTAIELITFRGMREIKRCSVLIELKL